MLLVAGRYAQVMAPSLYGREVNLYWDLQHVSAVAAMLTRVASTTMLVSGGVALVLVVAGSYAAGRWAIGHVATALGSRDRRRLVLWPAVIVAALFGLDGARPGLSPISFVTPVSSTYAHQVRLIAQGLGRGPMSGSLPDSPPMDSNLHRLDQADVVVLFIESYGAVSFDRDTFARRLAPSRLALDQAVRDTERQMVSAYVTSPTFGGSSWLAHISLMTGIEVRDADTNARLMTQERETLATFFRGHGYRTVAFMPGLSQNWPEGAFYKFDDVVDATRMAYPGPEFGWWTIPDQFSLAKLNAHELTGASRPPVFALLPTISTHTPFKPTPPYQPDWQRVVGPRPFDDDLVERSMSEEPDWDNLSPSYADALEYAYTTLAGFLRETKGRNLVLVVVGDHQPPALVSGEGARWEVPVHVITHHGEIATALMGGGFVLGGTPRQTPLGPMHGLLPTLLNAFHGPEPLSESTGGR